MIAPVVIPALPPAVFIVASALAFAVGGIFMKLSQGMTQLPGTIGLFACFILGAALQTLALRQADLGVAYIAVLGLEAALAFGFGVYFFQEVITPWRLLAVGLIVGGIAILR